MHSDARRRNLLTGSIRAALALAAATALSPAHAADPMEEIVVTARKRVETLQEVPLAVTAINAEQLQAQGITNVVDTYSRVPNLYFTAAGGASPTSDYQYLIIRGVGFNGGLEPAVGVFIDGMYQPQIAFDTSFLDAERVEVLRGPQGTLFGRNTQAGALNIVTRKPGKDFEGRVELEGGSYSTYRALASVMGPLGDTLSGGLSLQYASSDGYSHNVVLDKDQTFYKNLVGRGTLMWTPTEAFNATLIADASRKDLKEPGFGSPLDCECYNNYADQIGPDDYKDTNGIQLNIDWKLTDSTTLTSITGYRDVKSRFTYDWDAHVTDQTPLTLSAVTETNVPGEPPVPLNVAPEPITVAGAYQTQPMEQEFISQELRLAGGSTRFDWLVGAYGFNQDMDQPRKVDIGPGVPFVPLYIREHFKESRDGWAVFGQVAFRPIEPLELTLGTRYSDESVDATGQRVINIADAAIRAFLKNNSSSADNVSSMASISYKLSSATNVYFTWSQGWKAGGINRYPSRANQDLPYDDETSDNYDLGLKGNWFDGRLSANLALFYVDIKDQQVLNVVPDPNGLTPITVITNAANSTSQGVELELTAQPTDNVRIGFTYGRTETEFKEFIQFGVDRKGDPFWFVPKTNASASIDYTIPLGGEDRSLDLGLTYINIAGYNVPDGNLNVPPATEIWKKGYDRLNFRANLKLQNGWEVTGYVRNVLDSYDYSNISRDQFATSFTSDTLYVVPLEPRVFGAVLTKKF
jgi:iron complex outermembrane receptor protein